MAYMKPSVIQSFSDIAIHPVDTPVSSPPMSVNILKVVDHPEKKWVVGNSLPEFRTFLQIATLANIFPPSHHSPGENSYFAGTHNSSRNSLTLLKNRALSAWNCWINVNAQFILINSCTYRDLCFRELHLWFTLNHVLKKHKTNILPNFIKLSKTPHFVLNFSSNKVGY